MTLTSYEYGVLRKGDPVRIRGRKGQFNFHAYSVGEGGEWVTCYGGQKDPGGMRQFISVAPEAVMLDPKAKKERDERGRPT